MAYIKNPDHFVNYIKKIIRETSDINPNNLLDVESYLDFIYSKNLSDLFTWDLKDNPQLLEHKNLLSWLQKNNSIGSFSIPTALEHILTAEFSNLLKNLKDIPGVYSFWSKKTPLYIGLSCNLRDRILTSFNERFNKYKKPVYLKYIATETSTDAAVLEVYFIGKLKPALNGASKYADDLTVKVKPEPNFSKPILCNRIKKDKNAKKQDD